MWTADLAHGAKSLLGWLHSHTDAYLAKLSVNAVEREFGGGSQCRVWLGELRDKGYITTEKVGQRYVITLMAEPWMALHQRKTATEPVATETVAADDEAATATETVAATATVAVAHRRTDLEDHPETPDLPIASRSSGHSSRADDAPRRSARQPTANDLMFDALVIACGMAYSEMTPRQKKACGVALSELVAVGATPEEIARRAEVFRLRFDCTLTPNALANQWAMCREAPLPAAPRTNGHMEGALAILAERKLRIAQ